MRRKYVIMMLLAAVVVGTAYITYEKFNPYLIMHIAQESTQSETATDNTGTQNDKTSEEAVKVSDTTPAPKADEVQAGAKEQKSESKESTQQPQKEEVPQSSVKVPGVVQEKAEAIAGKNVSSEDFMKAAALILKKLSFSEIKFIFDSARDDFWVSTSVEEIEKVRNIIFTKLSASDIATLREMGRKYGRSMTILNPDIDVAKEKAKEVAKKEKTSQTQNK